MKKEKKRHPIVGGGRWGDGVTNPLNVHLDVKEEGKGETDQKEIDIKTIPISTRKGREEERRGADIDLGRERTISSPRASARGS